MVTQRTLHIWHTSVYGLKNLNLLQNRTSTSLLKKKKLNLISCHPNGTVRERCYFWEGLVWVNIITVRFLTNLYELYFLLVDKFNQILFIRHLFTLVDKPLDRNLIRQGSPKKEIISLSKMLWGNSVLDFTVFQLPLNSCWFISKTALRLCSVAPAASHNFIMPPPSI